MFLTHNQQSQLSACFSLLAQDLNEREIRSLLGEQLLRLFEADYFASFVWDEVTGQFGEGVSIHMDPANLDRYVDWYQFRDPITPLLQQRRHATLVSEVLPRAKLLHSEFFNDFLARDGLCWGINLHAFDGSQALGDLRIWRGRQRCEFNNLERDLLQLFEPAFVAALRRARATRTPEVRIDRTMLTSLSARETEVVRCIGQGMTDKEIARELHISLTSVRTYVQRIFEKTGVRRRASVARLIDHS